MNQTLLQLRNDLLTQTAAYSLKEKQLFKVKALLKVIDKIEPLCNEKGALNEVILQLRTIIQLLPQHDGLVSKEGNESFFVHYEKFTHFLIAKHRLDIDALASNYLVVGVLMGIGIGYFFKNYVIGIPIGLTILFVFYYTKIYSEEKR
jgi:hypothetical protein